MRLVNHIDIAAPASLIFEWISDGKRVSQWVECLIDDMPVDQKEGHVGSTFRQLYRENGRSIEMDGEVLEWVQDQRVVIYLKCSQFEMELEMTIEPHDERHRRVTQVAEIQMAGFAKVMMWLCGWMMRGKAERQGQADLERLRDLCEAEAARRRGA